MYLPQPCLLGQWEDGPEIAGHRVNFVLKEKSRDARFPLAVDDGPIDGGSAHTGEQRAVQVF